MQVAVDASVLVALLNPRDLWHARAQSLLDALLDAHTTPVYFDCVIAEAVSAVARRLHEKGRVDEVRILLDRLRSRVPRESLTWILPDVPRLYARVLELMGNSSGELNFNDALIALACRERVIPAVASFDPDFDQIGWLNRLATSEDVSVGS